MNCDPHAKISIGRAPFFHACGGGNVDLVKYLVKMHHCDPLSQDEMQICSLHWAAYGGCLDVVKYLTETLQVDPHVKDRNGWTPLHWAAYRGHLEVIRFLTEDTNCDPHAKTSIGRTPLHHACLNGNVNLVKYLVDTHHCDPLSRDEDDETPLYWAASRGYSDVVKYFAETVQVKDEDDWTSVLLAAASNGHLKVVEFLIEDMNCDPHVKTLSGRVPLHLASQNGNVDFVKYLVDAHNCDPLSRDNKQAVPLHLAASNGHINVVKYFVETLQVDFHVKDKNGWTPLHWAACNGHLEVVRFLTEDMNCDPHAKTLSGNVPLHLASQNGNVNLVKYLVDKHHCDFLSQDNERALPLHLAASNGHIDVVKYFSETPLVDFHVKDKNGWTPLHWAAYHSHLEVVRVLTEDMNYDPHAKTFSGSIPLHLASKSGDVNLVKYLVDKHHCDPLSRDEEHRTPLYWAASKGYSDVVKYFADTLQEKDEYDWTSLLLEAASNGRLRVVEFLIEDMNCDPHVKTFSGRVPLHLASQSGNADLVKYLVDTHHCDPLSLDEKRTTPLHLAAFIGDLDVVKYFVETLQVEPHIRDENDWTPLHWATYCSFCVEVVRFLTEDMNCDPHAKTASGRVPLHLASESNDVELVEYLVDTHHCDPLSQDEEYTTPLHLAASNGCLDVVKYFTETLHVDPRVKDKYDWTPLHKAVYKGHLKIVKFLTESMKCDPHAKTSSGWAPLHLASGSGNADLVKYLVETHHCDPLSQDDEHLTPLYLAVYGGFLDVVNYFTGTLKVDPHVKDENGWSSLHWAVYYGHLEVVRFLTEDMNCDPYAKTFSSQNDNVDPVKYLEETQHSDLLSHVSWQFAASRGHLDVVKYYISLHQVNSHASDIFETLLNVATSSGQFEVVKFLTEDMKCNPHAIDFFSEKTLLHLASKSGNVDLVKYLVDTHHCDPLSQDVEQAIPLHLAASEGCIDVVMYFIENLQGSPHARDEDDRTPLHYASFNGHLEVVKFLIKTMKCDPHAKISSKSNFVHLACESGHANAVKYLERFAFKVDIFDAKYRTPLLCASSKGHLEVVKYLVDDVNCDSSVADIHGKNAVYYAKEGNHFEVMKYLMNTDGKLCHLSISTLSPVISIFVLGNSKSGKSTLVKSLYKEESYFGWLFKVSGVIPHTAGIVTTTMESSTFGKVNIYDFAGHEEYYASHEILLRQVAEPIILLVVNVSLPSDEIERQLQYWFHVLSNSQTANHGSKMHVVVVRSHADKEKNLQKFIKVEHTLVTFHGIVSCDCRFPNSDGLKQLRQKLKILCHTVGTKSTSKLCDALMHYLRLNHANEATVTLGKVSEQIKLLHYPQSWLANYDLLHETSLSLSSAGHLLYLPCTSNKHESLLILKEGVVLSQIHACLNKIKNDSGIVEESTLNTILSDLLKNAMKPDVAVEYLLLSQFCTKISTDQLIFQPHLEDAEHTTHYFFPNLVQVSAPSDLWTRGGHTYSHSYTWCLKCADGQFFTPRFLHTLFIQLVKFENENESTRYVVWKNGIFSVLQNGTRYSIDITEQTSLLQFSIQCMEGHEEHLPQQRFAVISLIKSLREKLCPSLQLSEFLLDSQHTSQLPIREVATAVVKCQPCVVTHDEIPQHVELSRFLHFDPFYEISELSIIKLFSMKDSEQYVPSDLRMEICEAVSAKSSLLKSIEIKAKQSQLTYSVLYSELHKYSIFTDGNLCALAGVDVPDCPTLLPIKEKPCMSILEQSRVIQKMAKDWKKLANHLELPPEVVDIVHCDTANFGVEESCREIFRRWLNGEGSQEVTWEKLLEILKDADRSTLAEELKQLIMSP